MSQAVIDTTEKIESTGTLTLLTFTMADQVYGIPVTEVVRIIEMVTLTRLPDVPDTVQGIINLQGKAVPVMDMRRRFGLPHRPYGLHTPIILVNIENNDRMLGLIVDAVEDVLDVVDEDTEKTGAIVPTDVVFDADTASLSGVAKIDRKMVLILNIPGLLSQVEHVELSKALDLTGAHKNGNPKSKPTRKNNRRKKT